MACHQVVIPMGETDVAAFINRRKMTALSGGRVTVAHMQTYARIIQIFAVENLGRARHLLMCAGTRDAADASAKKQWAEFEFTSLIFLANAARL